MTAHTDERYAVGQNGVHEPHSEHVQVTPGADVEELAR